jgi:hypothetical protein
MATKPQSPYQALYDQLEQIDKTPARTQVASGNPNVTPAFMAKLDRVASNLGVASDDLYQIMQFESGIDPHKRNKAGSGATGLIQFMPSTAKNLGTSTDKLAGMSSEQQLDYVEKYFKRQGYGPNKPRNQSDIYMSVLYPAAVGKPDSYPLFKQGTTAYRQNAGLDLNRDGAVTKQEASSKVFKRGARSMSAPTQAAPQAAQPNIPAQPFDLGRPFGHPFAYDENGILRKAPENQNTLAQDIQNNTDDLTKRLQSYTSTYKPKPQTEQPDMFKALRDQLAEVDKPKPQPKQQPAPTQGGFDLGKILQDTVGQVAGGFQTQFQNSPINAKDPGDFLYKSLVSQNPMVQAGAGALSETANFANGITDLAGLGKPIPTGGLNDFTAQAPVFSTFGRALPYIAGEGAALKAGEKLLPAATKAVMSSPVSRTLAGAGVNAAEGFLVDPGEAGMEGRVTNAALGGGLGALLHGTGEAIGSRLAKRQPVDLAPEKPATPELVQTLKPGEINPIESTAQPQELTQAFKQRGGDLGQPTRNLDAQIVDTAGKPIQPTQSGVNKSPYQIALERNRAPIDLGSSTPRIEAASAPTGRLDAEGGKFQPDLSPARKSADVLFGKQSEIDTATQLRDEAIIRLQEAENQLANAAGVEDVAEAQRFIGNRINELESKASTQALTPIEREDLAANRALFDEVMNARKDVLAAEPLVDEASAVTPRSSIETPTVKDNLTVQPKSIESPATPKRPIRDLAAPGAKNALNQESPILTPRALDETPTTSLLDSQGRPLSKDLNAQPKQPIDLGATKEQPRILDSTGEPMAPRDLASPSPAKPTPPITEPQSPPVIEGNTAKTTTGKEVFTQGRQAEDVQRLVQQFEQAKTGSQLVNYEDAQRLLLDKQKAGLLTPEQAQTQLDTLRMFVEAGQTGKTFNAARREIQEGLGTISEQLGKDAVKTRDDLNPFAITVRQRKPSTEVSNLVKQLGSPEAALDKMRSLASQFGITPTTKGRTIKAIATNIGKQIAESPKGRHYFSDVYLNAHNFKTGGVRSAFDAPRGYPLRTFEQASIGEHPSIIPTGAVNQNQISQQFQALKDISNSAMVSPELKTRVDKMLQKPYPSRKDIADVRKLLQDPKVLEQFCNIFGHGR